MKPTPPGAGGDIPHHAPNNQQIDQPDYEAGVGPLPEGWPTPRADAIFNLPPGGYPGSPTPAGGHTVAPGGGVSPGGGGFPAPAGPNGESPSFTGDLPRNWSDSFAGLDDKAVLCNTCEHGHIVVSRANVGNLRFDGTPFEALFGQCLFVNPPMSLEELRPVKCNRYAKIGESQRYKIPQTAGTDSGHSAAAATPAVGRPVRGGLGIPPHQEKPNG